MSGFTVAVADDHIVVRTGLSNLLASEPSFRVVGEARDGTEALDLVHRTRPDVIVMDLNMPGVSGIEAIRQLNRSSSLTKILVLSMHSDRSFVQQAFESGAHGYCLKDSCSKTLVDAVKAVAAGVKYLSADLERTSSPPTKLSDREMQVLRLLSTGHSNLEIAQSLGISPRTIEVHRASVMQKLSLRNHSDLVRYAIKHGVSSLDG